MEQNAKQIACGACRLRILYEDDSVIAVEKPAGMLSQGVPSGERSVLDYIDEYADGAFRTYPVHRLDRGTGGVLLCAKTQPAAAELSSLFAAGALHKEYLAAAHGELNESATLEHELYFDRRANKSYAVKKGAARRGVKHAVLDYVPLAVLDEPSRTVLAVRLHTGRTHQIRCQLAAVGHPLVGDRRYGGRGSCECSLWSHRLCLDTDVVPTGIRVCKKFLATLSAEPELLVSTPSGFPWEA